MLGKGVTYLKKKEEVTSDGNGPGSGTVMRPEVGQLRSVLKGPAGWVCKCHVSCHWEVGFKADAGVWTTGVGCPAWTWAKTRTHWVSGGGTWCPKPSQACFSPLPPPDSDSSGSLPALSLVPPHVHPLPTARPGLHHRPGLQGPAVRAVLLHRLPDALRRRWVLPPQPSRPCTGPGAVAFLGGFGAPPFSLRREF